MRALHLFFQLHQPYSLKAPEGGEHEYFGGGADFREANQKYYQPFFALLERNTQRYAGLKVSLLVSGSWLDQAELYEPELVRRLQKLVDLKQVELVAAPYYHSLSAFYDKDEFNEQVALARQKFEGKFSTHLSVLAAPGLMYHDRLAKWAEKAGFRGALAGDAAGVLDFRSAGRVYEAAGCEDFRVLFEDGRLSQALVQGEDLVLAAQAMKAEDFSEVSSSVVSEETEGSRTMGARKRGATAAEFVRGRAGVSHATEAASRRSVGGAGAVGSSGLEKKVYSAKKLQKELYMACLRGNLVSLCLDARMFGEQRDKGVVACFDEFFANWLKVPGNKFLMASEVFETEAFKPTAEISVKSTIQSRGMLGDFDIQENGVAGAGLAKVEEVQFTLPEGFRAETEDKLYDLRARVLKTKNEDLKHDFQKLTTMDYAFGKFREDFGKVLEDFEARVDDLLPKPKQLRAENAGADDVDEAESAGAANLTASRTAEELKGVTGDEEPEPENDYTVKVHRILKKASAEQAKRQVRPEDFELESGELEEDLEVDDVLDEELDEFDVVEDVDDADEVEIDDETDEVVDMSDAFDEAEAELQVIAQRMKRSKQESEIELEALMEAEVVSVSTPVELDEDKKTAGRKAKNTTEREARAASGAKKKKTHRRIVLD